MNNETCTELESVFLNGFRNVRAAVLHLLGGDDVSVGRVELLILDTIRHELTPEHIADLAVAIAKQVPIVAPVPEEPVSVASVPDTLRRTDVSTTAATEVRVAAPARVDAPVSSFDADPASTEVRVAATARVDEQAPADAPQETTVTEVRIGAPMRADAAAPVDGPTEIPDPFPSH